MYTRDYNSIEKYFLVSSCDFLVAILFCLFSICASFEPHKDHNLCIFQVFGYFGSFILCKLNHMNQKSNFIKKSNVIWKM